jgi:hypothetical protein
LSMSGKFSPDERETRNPQTGCWSIPDLNRRAPSSRARSAIWRAVGLSGESGWRKRVQQVALQFEFNSLSSSQSSLAGWILTQAKAAYFPPRNVHVWMAWTALSPPVPPVNPTFAVSPPTANGISTFTVLLKEAPVVVSVSVTVRLPP